MTFLLEPNFTWLIGDHGSIDVDHLPGRGDGFFTVRAGHGC